MEVMEKELTDLVAKGKSQGFLTYEEVNNYLPDEDASPEKLDNLLLAIEDQGIELVDDVAEVQTAKGKPSSDAGDGIVPSSKVVIQS